MCDDPFVPSSWAWKEKKSVSHSSAEVEVRPLHTCLETEASQFFQFVRYCDDVGGFHILQTTQVFFDVLKHGYHMCLLFFFRLLLKHRKTVVFGISPVNCSTSESRLTMLTTDARLGLKHAPDLVSPPLAMTACSRIWPT